MLFYVVKRAFMWLKLVLCGKNYEELLYVVL